MQKIWASATITGVCLSADILLAMSYTGLKSHGFCLQTVGHRDEQTGPVKVLKVDEGNIKQTHCNLKSMGSFIWFLNYYRSNVFLQCYQLCF